jgi:Skp family chaperone for outer membrane proteins
MKIRNTAIVAALLSATAIAVPATAQVSGIATAETSVAIARSKALGTAYQQIGTQYAAVVQQMQTKRQEINNINAQLDTNKDKELTQAELDVAINPLQEPIILAQLYAVEQVAVKYEAAQQAVVAAKKISVILAPDAFVWAPEAVDVTSAITAELDKAIPAASITPPAGYRPSRQIGALYQQIQQLFNNAAQMQAAQAAAAQPRAAAPAAQPESR